MSVNEQLLDAICKIADDSVKKAQYDKTIQAQVLSCEDATIGKYRCRYQDAIIYAYSNNSDISYGNGAYVYILVPGGDMGKEKTILGTPKKLGINYISQAQGDEAYDIIGNNCVISDNKYYLNTDNQNYRYTIYNATDNNNFFDKQALNQYIKESSSVIVGGIIKTSIKPEKQYQGHYGITYNLKFNDSVNNTEVIRSYTINENNMVDNPYRLVYGTRQYQIFEIDGPNFIQVQSIQIFNSDFPGANKISSELLTEGDIEISNLELSGAVRMTENEINGVAITFYTPQGKFFTGNKPGQSKIITAQVRVKGKLASAAQNIPFYWGSENVSIGANNPYYNKFLGIGWKCLNDSNIIQGSEDQPSIVEWIPGTDTYILKFENATARNNKLKVAIIYDGVTISKTINIQNLAEVPQLTIESSEGTKFYYDIGHPNLICKVNGGEPDDYIYNWAYEDSSGILRELPETTQDNNDYLQAIYKRDEIQYKISIGERFAIESQQDLNNAETAVNNFNFIQRVQGNKIYNVQIRNITSFGTFKCSVFNNNGVYLGTTSLILTNTLEGQNLYSVVINNGAATFQYNENGIAPNNKSLVTQQQIQSLSFTVYDNLGQSIDENIIANDKNCKIRWYFPIKDTLLVDKQENGENSGTDATLTYKYYDNKTILLYDIAQKYNIKKQNNQIRLTVDYKGMNLTTQTQFNFIKQGEPGTNGTEYIVKLVPNVMFGYQTPLWPMITHAGDKYLLNYRLSGESQEYTDRDESIIRTNENYRLLKAQLWHNGELIWEGFSNSDKALDNISVPALVNWEILRNEYSKGKYDNSVFEITNEENRGKGLIQYKVNSQTNLLNPSANIIKCSITWQGKTYYGTIPITTAQTVNENYRVGLKDYTGFRYVIYSSDGVLPQYDNSYPFEFTCQEKINNIWEDVSNVQGEHKIYYSQPDPPVAIGTTEIENSNLLEILTSTTYRNDCNDNQWWARPASRYDGISINNAICCVFKRKYVDSNNEEFYNEIGRINVPIHFLLNKYGLAHINEWDGNSVQVNNDGGFILSPQMGAGHKEDNNFTGVLMGTVQFPEKKKTQTGLLGINSGDRTFFLNSQNGSAIFGKNNNGQIIIDPHSDKAMLYSGNFWEDSNYDTQTGLPKDYKYRNNNYKPSNVCKKEGMIIDLTTPEIYFGSGNFYVNSEGHIHAAGGGDIGGWVVDNHSLYSNIKSTEGRITLDAGTYNEETNTVTGPGKIYSHNHNSLNTAGKGFYLSNDGLSIGTKFKIDVSDDPDGTNKGGTLRLGLGAVDPSSSSDHWIIDGKESNDVQKYTSKGEIEKDQNGNPLKISKSRSFISYGNNANDTYFIPAGQQHNSKVYIGTDGISLGNNFSVDNQGNLISRTGYIGGWEITSNTLKAQNIILNSNGSISGGYNSIKINDKNVNTEWSINTFGQANFNYLTASNGGNIGGWTIYPVQKDGKGNITSYPKLSAGSMYLSGDGSIGGLNWSISNTGEANFSKLKGVVPNNYTIKVNGTVSSGGSSGMGLGGKGGGWVSPSTPTSYGGNTTLQGHFDTLYATKATIKELEADIAKVGDLSIDKILRVNKNSVHWGQVVTNVVNAGVTSEDGAIKSFKIGITTTQGLVSPSGAKYNPITF